MKLFIWQLSIIIWELFEDEFFKNTYESDGVQSQNGHKRKNQLSSKGIVWLLLSRFMQTTDCTKYLPTNWPSKVNRFLLRKVQILWLLILMQSIFICTQYLYLPLHYFRKINIFYFCGGLLEITLFWSILSSKLDETELQINGTNYIHAILFEVIIWYIYLLKFIKYLIKYLTSKSPTHLKLEIGIIWWKLFTFVPI